MMLATDTLLEPGVLDIANVSREPDLALSAVAAVTAALSTSRVKGTTYDLLATVDCYVAISLDPSGVTTLTGYPLLAGNSVSFYVPAGFKIGAVTAGTTGSLLIHRSK